MNGLVIQWHVLKFRFWAFKKSCIVFHIQIFQKSFWHWTGAHWAVRGWWGGMCIPPQHPLLSGVLGLMNKILLLRSLHAEDGEGRPPAPSRSVVLGYSLDFSQLSYLILIFRPSPRPFPIPAESWLWGGISSGWLTHTCRKGAGWEGVWLSGWYLVGRNVLFSNVLWKEHGQTKECRVCTHTTWVDGHSSDNRASHIICLDLFLQL